MYARLLVVVEPIICAQRLSIPQHYYLHNFDDISFRPSASVIWKQPTTTTDSRNQSVLGEQEEEEVIEIIQRVTIIEKQESTLYCITVY
jgi:hypothetical protein